jgi:hypothetical protein
VTAPGGSDRAAPRASIPSFAGPLFGSGPGAAYARQLKRSRSGHAAPSGTEKTGPGGTFESSPV